MALQTDRIVFSFVQKLKPFLAYLTSTFQRDPIISKHISDVLLFTDANPAAAYRLYRDEVYKKFQHAIDQCDEQWVTNMVEEEAKASGTTELFKRVFHSPEINDMVKAETFRYMIILGNICRTEDH